MVEILLVMEQISHFFKQVHIIKAKSDRFFGTHARLLQASVAILQAQNSTESPSQAVLVVKDIGLCDRIFRFS